jgi:hypothetical protein
MDIDWDEFVKIVTPATPPVTVRKSVISRATGWSERTIGRKVAAKILPPPRVGTGRGRRWLLSDLVAWANEQRAKTEGLKNAAGG